MSGTPHVMEQLSMCHTMMMCALKRAHCGCVSMALTVGKAWSDHTK